MPRDAADPGDLEELRFGGPAILSSTEVTVPSPATGPGLTWWQVMEQAFIQLSSTDEGRELYGDPMKGGTLAQTCRVTEALLGIHPVCLVVAGVPRVLTEGIARLVSLDREGLVANLVRLFTKVPEAAVQVCENDGRSGHSITLTGWDADRSRFLYHDPWPGDSLLATQNNIAGVSAQPEGDRTWSITDAELRLVIVAAILFPRYWAKVSDIPAAVTRAELTTTDFWSFFRVHEIGVVHGDDGGVTYQLKTGGFQEFVDLELRAAATDEIASAELMLNSSWVIGPPMGISPFALDIAGSFLRTLMPPPDREAMAPLLDDLSGLGNPMSMKEKLMSASFSASPSGRLIAAYTGLVAETQLAFDYSTLTVATVARGDPETEPADWLRITVNYF
jgi:hypothetical protein